MMCAGLLPLIEITGGVVGTDEVAVLVDDEAGPGDRGVRDGRIGDLIDPLPLRKGLRGYGGTCAGPEYETMTCLLLSSSARRTQIQITL